MTTSIPGAVVFVDNNEDDVKETIRSFWNDGETVTFFPGTPEEEKIPPNTRLLILDIALGSEDYQPDADLPQLALFIERVAKKTKFCVVVLWSAHIYEDNPAIGMEFITSIRSKYQEQTHETIPPYFFIYAIPKTRRREHLLSKIDEIIQANPYIGIVFEWEKLNEVNRDNAVADIVNSGEIKNILNLIARESGKESLPREIVSLFNKILHRHMCLHEDLRDLKRQAERGLAETPEAENILVWFKKFYNLTAYYRVTSDEKTMTGDIFKTDFQDNPDREYSLVITPPCDFANKTNRKIKLIYGMKFISIPNYNPERDTEVPLIVKKIGNAEIPYKKPETVRQILFNNQVKENFYILYYLSAKTEPEIFFNLLLDFDEIDSLKEIPRTWTHICRVDSPWIEDITQHISSNSARIGVQSIPKDIRTLELTPESTGSP